MGRGAGWVALLSLWLAGSPIAAVRAQGVETAREAPAGGLVLVPDYALGIAAYEVTVAADEIKALYTIANSSTEPRTILVTLAMPDIDTTALGDQVLVLPKPDPVNFIGATYTIDGVAAVPRFEQRALAFGLDVTADLVAAGVPLFPFAPGMAERLRRLPDAHRADFAERGIVRLDDDKVLPGWTLKTTAYWRQTFAPAKSVVIALTYQPVAARMATDSAVIEGLKRSHCLDAAAEAVLSRRPQGGGPPLRALTYALTAGSSWAGPAASFRLLVRKPASDVLVATCRKGLKPIGPTVLEWTARDFYPDDDVAVVFIR